MIFDWASQSPTSLFAQQMRRDIRARRRAFSNGKRFIYKDLAQVWVAEHHAVLTHLNDPTWQHWAYHFEHGWMPIGIYPAKEDATAAAEVHEWDVEYPEPTPEPGVYVLAGWPCEEGEPVYTVRTRCETKNSAIAVADTLRSIGMVTKHEEIGA